MPLQGLHNNARLQNCGREMSIRDKLSVLYDTGPCWCAAQHGHSCVTVIHSKEENQCIEPELVPTIEISIITEIRASLNMQDVRER